jgi:hypothetical protein
MLQAKQVRGTCGLHDCPSRVLVQASKHNARWNEFIEPQFAGQLR